MNCSRRTFLEVLRRSVEQLFGRSIPVELRRLSAQPRDEYCNICNPFQYDTSIMANAGSPHGTYPGHGEPVRGYRQQHAACGFVREAQRSRRWPSGIVEARSVRRLREEDRGRGAGQPESCGPIPRSSSPSTKAAATTTPATFSRWTSSATARASRCIVISPFTKPGHITHNYADHVSILKFIERNWCLKPVTSRSRDNFPNPVTAPGGSPYVPTNSPAISDLFELFSFPSSN